ncbi:MAG: hypothetical protein D3906_04560 [Candidatus Electrothrix sp. AUS1_2]|nr:hypothetical protein [Candidatus Electrothrix sp. AUS1_2]
MKKVTGAVLVALMAVFLFSGPVLADRKKHDSLKKQVDQNLLVAWWVWSLAYSSGDKTKLWAAAAIFEQAMRFSAAFEDASINGDISDSNYALIFDGASSNSYAIMYFYQGSPMTYSYYSRAQTAVDNLPQPAATNTVYRILVAVQTVIYTGTTTEPEPQPPLSPTYSDMPDGSV